MKNMVAILFAALAFLAVSAMGKDAWMNKEGGYVRWEKPTTITLDGLTVYNRNHSLEDLEKGGFYYVSNAPDCEIADMVIDYQAGTIRELTEAEKLARLEAQRIIKDPFMVATETQYTNLLIAVGMSGAWADMDYTYAQVGQALVANNRIVELLFLDKLYNILLDYYGKYGGTDLRLYPWGSPYVYEPTE